MSMCMSEKLLFSNKITYKGIILQMSRGRKEPGFGKCESNIVVIADVMFYWS